MAKKPREWMAIVTTDERKGNKWKPRPIVIQNDDGEVATFSSPDEIEELSMQHALCGGVWSAFNFTSGEVVVL